MAGHKPLNPVAIVLDQSTVWHRNTNRHIRLNISILQSELNLTRWLKWQIFITCPPQDKYVSLTWPGPRTLLQAPSSPAARTPAHQNMDQVDVLIITEDVQMMIMVMVMIMRMRKRGMTRKWPWGRRCRGGLPHRGGGERCRWPPTPSCHLSSSSASSLSSSSASSSAP